MLLDEVDQALERRGHAFVRYADDCNAYVRSERAGQRVMALLRRLYGRLRLSINERKSAVARCWNRPFLGYWMYGRRGKVYFSIAPGSQKRLEARVRQLTARNRGRSMQQIVAALTSYLRGWKQYFSLAGGRKRRERLDGWIRRAAKVAPSGGLDNRFFDELGLPRLAA